MLRIQRNLLESAGKLDRTNERLSSGLRINRAADDAAGLSITSNLDAQKRIYSKAISNGNDAISISNVAQGALEQLETISTRQRELATQAANGTYSRTQRKALDQEADALTAEFNRIVATTAFNGVNVFAAADTQINFQLGSGTQELLRVALSSQLSRVTGDGTFSAAGNTAATGGSIYDIKTCDFNGDGKLDAVTARSSAIVLYAGNGDGTFQAPQTVAIAAGSKYAVEAGDLNNDGRIDIVVSNTASNTIAVALQQANGSFSATSYAAVTAGLLTTSLADVNNDGNLDAVSIANSGGVKVGVAFGKGDGTFAAPTTAAVPGIINTDALTVNDFNADGKADIAIADFASGNVLVSFGNGDGTFGSNLTLNNGFGVAGRANSGDLDADGVADIFVLDTTNHKGHVFLSHGDGTFGTVKSYNLTAATHAAFADFNGDGINDVVASNSTTNAVQVLINNGDGSFCAPQSYNLLDGTGNGVAAGDLNGDGVLDLVAPSLGGTNTINILIGDQTKRTDIAVIDLTTQSSAKAAMSTIDKTLERITNEMGELGAFQSRMTVALSLLNEKVATLEGAKSRIADVDVAQETAVSVSETIRQQATASLLAHAKQDYAIALRLLNG